MFLGSIMLLPKATSSAPAFFLLYLPMGLKIRGIFLGPERDLLPSWRLHSALIVLCMAMLPFNSQLQPPFLTPSGTIPHHVVRC
jgi:hypothetical protein